MNWSKGICAIWQLEGVYWIFQYYESHEFHDVMSFIDFIVLFDCAG